MGRPGTKFARLQQFAALAREARHSSDPLADFRSALQSGSTPERAYRASVPLAHRKRFAQFFTPPDIARLMVEWIAAIHPKTILDPAVGPGIFPKLIRELLPASQITALDLDPLALSAARSSLADLQNIHFLQGDFLAWHDSRSFDAAISNPPYLRHHDVHYGFDIFRAVGNRNRIQVSRLSNVYALFILEICRRLRAGGRAAILVPGEWVNANFGASLKQFLLTRGYLQKLLYFSHASTQFEDALTTASVLFIEKTPSSPIVHSVRTVFVRGDDDFNNLAHALHDATSSNPATVVQHFPADQLLREKKWNHLLSAGSRPVAPGFVPLSALAATRRGIATGCNSFFLLSPSATRQWRIRTRNLLPCIGRAADAPSFIFTQRDLDRIISNDRPVYLFHLRSKLSKSEEAYIHHGERLGLNHRYLCSVHSPRWFSMEQRPPSAIWACVFGRKGLRFIHNASPISNLTTFHCIYPHRSDPIFAAALTACLNSPTVQSLAQRQLRVYGGGLFKMEPNDLLEIAVPDLRRVRPETLATLASCLGSLDSATRINRGQHLAITQLDSAVRAALDEVDPKTCVERVPSPVLLQSSPSSHGLASSGEAISK